MKYKVAHIGIKASDADSSLKIAELFSKAFGFSINEGTASNYVSDNIEIMKGESKGACGHIAIETEDCENAIKDLRKKGFDVDLETAKYTPDGRIRVIYLKDEIGGFAIHLIKKTN